MSNRKSQDNLRFPSGTTVRRARSHAKTIKQTENVKLSEALDKVAVQNGLPMSWSDSMNYLTNFSVIQHAIHLGQKLSSFDPQEISFSPEGVTGLDHFDDFQVNRNQFVQFLDNLEPSSLMELIILMYAGRDYSELTSRQAFLDHCEYMKRTFSTQQMAVESLVEKSISLQIYLNNGKVVAERLGFKVVDQNQTLKIEDLGSSTLGEQVVGIKRSSKVDSFMESRLDYLYESIQELRSESPSAVNDPHGLSRYLRYQSSVYRDISEAELTSWLIDNMQRVGVSFQLSL